MKQFSLEEYLKNPNQKVVTRDGRKVTILCTNYSTKPIIAEIEDLGHSYSFFSDGTASIEGDDACNDLFFDTEKHEGWVNLYLDANYNSHTPGACIYKSKKSAEKEGKSCKNYITTAKIEWEE